MNNQKISDLGVEARMVLENPAFIEALNRMRTDVTTQWKECPIRDREGQLLLLQLAKLTEKFEGTFRSMVEAGKLAHAKIDIDDVRNESRIQRIKRRVL